MLVEYLRAGMERAHYEIIQDEEPFYGEIPGVEGVWATGRTLEECRDRLAMALEDWILFSVAQGYELPVLGSVRLTIPQRTVLE
ncbi:MAG: type II toxin-antitoxin system HicB family antitoxin [Deltaproteobacteria bacterium]|nr:type II toxin-antitoxin system HicB family antitoxin [Deltaproteobacteria bacterium]